MKVERGSNLESVLINHKTQLNTMKAAGFGGDTTLTDVIGDIKVTTAPDGKSTVQFGKKAAPIKVSL